jgi:hypothetical protein
MRSTLWRYGDIPDSSNIDILYKTTKEKGERLNSPLFVT